MVSQLADFSLRDFATRDLATRGTKLLVLQPPIPEVPRLAISLPHDFTISIAKFSGLFSRGPKMRSHMQIQWSSHDLDPTVVLLSLLAFSRL
jgi:hypothetical protein